MNKTETRIARLYRWAKGTVFFGDSALAVSLWAGLFGAASGTLSLVNLARPHPVYPWEAYAPLGAAIAAYAAGGLTMLGAYLSAKAVKRSQDTFEKRIKRLEGVLNESEFPQSVTMHYANTPVIYRAQGYRLNSSLGRSRQLKDVV